MDLPPAYGDTSVQLAMGEDKPIVDDDPWALPELQPTGKPWADMTTSERVQRVVINIVKIITLLSLLYLFICSLDFLSQAFRLVGGRTASQVFSSSELLTNPVVGLMMGCLVTVLVQSSSTSTSIIVSMVASGLLQVRTCIPMIMGANIGTSITNTIVSLTQVADRNEFRRAFGGATVHDMFNWLAVLSLLPLELIIQAINPSGQGYLELMTDAILNSVNLDTAKGHKLKLLKVITSPFTSLVIKTDKKVLTGWALNDSRYFDASLVKHYCKYETTTVLGVNNVTETVKVPLERCNSPGHSLFSLTDLPDLYVGLILLVIALVLLCGCLVLMVKILHTLLKGSIAVVIRKTLNANIPYMPWLTGYLAILVGCGMTILVQSSSVFTSAMTPLVGVGVISLDRMYPLTLGSNIGTTTTAILAALAASGDTLRPSIQIALVHFFFNISGILLFYVLPFMRWPIPLARGLGNITADYRWFAVAYLLGMFLLLPLVVFGLSLAGAVVLYVVLALVAVLALAVGLLNLLQRRAPRLLPDALRTWEFLPEPLRSLAPYDRLVSALTARCRCCRSAQADDSAPEKSADATLQFNGKPTGNGFDNPALEMDVQPVSYSSRSVD
ncbi:sodium-dependent phosphate transport protein 2B-like isoform X1 [Amphibalanus amphitrite]|uniref:sodium-dependent phosphate transport protein 2B-like isoform X1 n=1 Tax=Amphibalanus amphitrite TaxID=1232801 RepID=UPI001C91D49C|nr:sodium-dependent phosphate transport protein 2B-like isoform X1 [Amphibalanus amphitrite]